MTKLATFVVIVSLAACGRAGGGSGIGIAECDQYLAKLAACAKKVGGQTGESLERSGKMFADVWKDNAKDDAMKAELPKTCTDATAAAKKQFAQCEW
jgi:hypothetical protein